jgi:hypothetical protein
MYMRIEQTVTPNWMPPMSPKITSVDETSGPARRK